MLARFLQRLALTAIGRDFLSAGSNRCASSSSAVHQSLHALARDG
jgi:hypothetical protein